MTIYFKGVDHNPPIQLPRVVLKADGAAYDEAAPTSVQISKDSATFVTAAGVLAKVKAGDWKYTPDDAEWDYTVSTLTVSLNDVLAVGDGQAKTVELRDPFDSYPTGAFVIDAGGAPGTDFGINGTPQNPCTTLADMRIMFTAADALGTAMKRCEITGVTPITLSNDDWDGWEFILGPNATLTGAGGTVTCDKLVIVGGTTVGVFDPGSAISISNSILATVTAHGNFHKNAFPNATSVTLNGTPNVFSDCFSTRSDGSSPTMDCGNVIDLSLRVTGYKGDLSLDNINGTGTKNIEVDGLGLLDLKETATPVLGTATNIVVSGNMHYTNTGGATGITLNTDAQVTPLTIETAVAEAVVGTYSGVAGSIAEHLDDIKTAVVTTIPGVLGTPTDTDLATDIANLDAVVDTVKAETVLILADTADMQPKLGAPVADLATDIATIDTEVGTMQGNVTDILADTATTIPALIGTPVADLATDIATIDDEIEAIDLVVDNILVDTTDMKPKLGTPVTDLAADIATIDTEVGNMQGDVTNILTDTGTTIPASLPAALTKGSATDAGTVNTLIDTAILIQGTDDWWLGHTVRFTSGTLDGQTALVIGFDQATDTLTFAPDVTVATATGHTYELIPNAHASIAAIGATPIVGDGVSPKFGV